MFDFQRDHILGDLALTNNLLDCALAYANYGWRVFPLHGFENTGCTCGDPSCPQEGLHPRLSEGWQAATTDQQTIRDWWQQYPDSNIGVRTGLDPANGRGLYVLHIDYARNADPELLSRLGLARLHRTRKEQSEPGAHRYYLNSPLCLPTTYDWLEKGVATLGEDAFVQVAPSRTRTGTNRWLNTFPTLN